MSNTVIKVDQSTLTKIKSYYETHTIDSSPPGSIFVAKKNGCTITGYRSGKVMFQGVHHNEEASVWGGETTATPSKGKQPKKSSMLPPHIETMSLIGSDEVGKGDYFGPLIVCATYVKKDQLALLKELGVQDSKNLKDPQIITIAKDLITFLPYSLLTLNNEKYNQLQAKGMTQGKMTAILHNRAIQNVIKKIAPEEPEGILVDQFAEAPVYFRHLSGQKEVVRHNIHFSTKAESIHLSVAAASMIARYAFVKAFDELSKQAGFSLTKGAGPKVDQNAARLIKAKGVSILPQFTKVHFANTSKAKKIAGILS